MGWRRWDREAEMETRVWKLNGEGGEEWDEVRWSRVGGGVRSRTCQGRECGRVDVSCMGLVSGMEHNGLEGVC